MKIVRNKYIPFAGYKAINLFGILFVRDNAKLSETDINHEAIHSAQIKEMLYAFFYVWYGIEWAAKLVKYRNTHKAYKNISFELEAYQNEEDIYYLEKRKLFSFLNYL